MFIYVSSVSLLVLFTHKLFQFKVVRVVALALLLLRYCYVLSISRAVCFLYFTTYKLFLHQKIRANMILTRSSTQSYNASLLDSIAFACSFISPFFTLFAIFINIAHNVPMTVRVTN